MIQLQFINKVLDSRDAEIITSNGITDEFFSVYKDEFDFIKSHIDTYGAVPDKETFFAKFPNCNHINVDESIEYLISELYNDKNARTLASTFEKIKSYVTSGKIEDAVSYYLQTSEKLVSSTPLKADNFIEMADIRYNEYLSKIENLSNYYIKTGFRELDALIGGWDRHEELVTIVARTNQGKSWILFKSAEAAFSQGLRVGIYEGEMSALKVGYRLDTFGSNVSNSGIIRGDRSIQQQYKEHIDNLKNKYKDGCCEILTPTSIGGMATVSTLRGFIDKYKLDILFVDQHSLLEDERKGKSPVEKASNISKDLKNLQVMKKIPIITVSQQNRTSTENGANTEHIAQSDRIGQDSTIVICFEQDKEQSMLTMNLVKSRDSAHNKKLKYAFDFDKGVFNYIVEDQGDNDKHDAEQIQQLHEKYDVFDNEISPF